jgi:hypothetical protein
MSSHSILEIVRNISSRSWNTPIFQKELALEYIRFYERTHELLDTLTVKEIDKKLRFRSLRQMARHPEDVLTAVLTHSLLASQETSKGKLHENTVKHFAKACGHPATLPSSDDVKKHPYLKGIDVCVVIRDDEGHEYNVGVVMTSKNITKNNAGSDEENNIAARFKEKFGQDAIIIKLVWEEPTPNGSYITGQQFVETISGDPDAWDTLLAIASNTVLETTDQEMIRRKVAELIQAGWNLPPSTPIPKPQRATLDWMFEESEVTPCVP